MAISDLDIDFVSAKYDGNVFANAFEVTMPVGNVFVGDTGGNVEHDDTALPLNVVSITETTKLLLTSSIPDIETDGTKVGAELERVNFDTEGGCGWLVKNRVSIFLQTACRVKMARARVWNVDIRNIAYQYTSFRIHQSNGAER